MQVETAEPVQLTIFTPLSQRIVDRIEATDVNSLTPLQALNLLEELQQELKEEDRMSGERYCAMPREVCWSWASAEPSSPASNAHGSSSCGPPASFSFAAISPTPRRRARCSMKPLHSARRTVFRCVDVEGGTRRSAARCACADAVRAGRGTCQPRQRTEIEPDSRTRRADRASRQGLRIQHHARAGARPGSACVRQSHGHARRRANADGVVEYARAVSSPASPRMESSGCGKHFPGLGGGTLDSHLETPAIHRTLRELNREDLAPYRELRNQLPMIMVNHAAYPDTPGGNRPASCLALLDYRRAAQADRLSRHHLLRRSGDGRNSQVPAHRGSRDRSHSRRDGPAWKFVTARS